MISIEPITADLGAEVRGIIGVSRQEVATILRRALLEHHLLVLRARVLSPAQQVSLARLFGAPALIKAPVIPEYPQILRVSNQPGERNNNVGRHWHVDGTREKNGIPISIWHVIEHPAEGGDTLFANMHRAYEELDEDFRRQVDGLKMVSVSGAAHQLVKRHPATQRKMLYTSIKRTANFIGMTNEQTKAVLDRLMRISIAPAVTTGTNGRSAMWLSATISPLLTRRPRPIRSFRASFTGCRSSAARRSISVPGKLRQARMLHAPPITTHRHRRVLISRFALDIERGRTSETRRPSP